MVIGNLLSSTQPSLPFSFFPGLCYSSMKIIFLAMYGNEKSTSTYPYLTYNLYGMCRWTILCHFICLQEHCTQAHENTLAVRLADLSILALVSDQEIAAERPVLFQFAANQQVRQSASLTSLTSLHVLRCNVIVDRKWHCIETLFIVGSAGVCGGTDAHCPHS